MSAQTVAATAPGRTDTPARWVVDAAAARWRLRLLGAFELSDGSQRVTRLTSRAVTALLARLALRPRAAHAREELIELLWPDVDPAAGRHRLRQALSTLRMLLEPPSAHAEPVLQADRQTIRLVDGALWCDATSLEAASREQRHAEVVTLYGGDLLPGFFDEWVIDERRRLEALHDRAVDSAARASPVSGRLAAASALSATHSRTAADGGAAPSPRPATNPTAAPMRPRLPTYLTRWVGADQQASRLRAEIGQQRLVTLLGPGGAGKTRLAVETAQGLLDNPPWPAGLQGGPTAPAFDLVAFVSLVDCLTGEQMLDRMAAVLLARGGGSNALGQLQAALADRRTLLVLDNFEQMDDEAATLLAALLGELPWLHALVTSRRLLGLDGEQVFPATALELPRAGLGLQEAALNPCVTLFVDRARAARTDFHLHAGNQEAIVDLVGLLEGMPLAIELAAARVRSLSPAEMAAMLRRARGGADGDEPAALDLLERRGPRAGHDTRHASMQQVIEWSWKLLSTDQARLLCALTALRGSFDAALVRDLCRGLIRQPLLRLDELAGHSLLRAADGAAGLRFSLYEPIREFAQAKLDDAQRHDLQGRLRAALIQGIAAFPATLPLAQVHANLPSLLGALAAAMHRGLCDEALNLMVAAHRIYEVVALPPAALAHLEAALAGSTGEPARCRGHLLLALRLLDAGRPADALAHVHRGVALAAPGTPQRARALYTLGRLRLSTQGHGEDLFELIEEIEHECGPDTDTRLRLQILSLRAHSEQDIHHDLDTAEALHLRTLALAQSLGDEVAINVAHYNLVTLAHARCNYALALRRVEPVIEQARQLHDHVRLGHAVFARATILGNLRRHQQAVPDMQESLRMAWDALARSDLEYRLLGQAVLLAHLRQPQLAAQLGAWCEASWLAQGSGIIRPLRRELVRLRRLLRGQLRPADLALAQAQGRALSLASAVALALKPV